MQMVKARTMSIFAYDKRTIEALLFWTKEAWNRRCCLGNNFLYMINLVYIVPSVYKISFDSDKWQVS